MARRRRILQGRAAQGIVHPRGASRRSACCSPAGWLLLRQDRTFSDSENRMLAQKPAPTLALAGRRQLSPSGLERWYADQFRRPRSVDHRGSDVSMRRLLGVREMNGVYLGADGYLLEAPAQEDAAQLGQTEAAICAFAAQHPDIRHDGRDRAERLGRAQRRSCPPARRWRTRSALIDAIDAGHAGRAAPSNLTEALALAPLGSRSITAPTTTGRAWPPATPLRRFRAVSSASCSRSRSYTVYPGLGFVRGDAEPQRPAATRRSIPSRSTSRTRTCSTP